jgi:hypothetical protein
MRALPAVLALAVAGVVSALQPQARAEPSATLVVDRTLVCAMGITGGIRKIELVGQSGTRDFADPSTCKALPRVELYNPYGGDLDLLAMISAGNPPPSGLSFVPNPARCKATRTSVSLSARQLTPAAASPIGDEYECRVPERVLLRIRGVFANPTTLRKIWITRERSYRMTVADGPIRESSLTVRTLDGRAVAKATVSESGKTRLFTAAGCGVG